MTVGESIPSHADQPPLVAIGGVGGSGTRAVAKLIRAMGIAMGDCLNETEDNLWFTALFKHVQILAASDAEFDARFDLFWRASLGIRFLVPADRARVDALATSPEKRAWLIRMFEPRPAGIPGVPWGWKEPNTHLVIDRIARRVPTLKYVHVLRNGLDMAFSPNQVQPSLWGEALTGRRLDATPRDSLTYWCVTTRLIHSMAPRLGGRLLLLDYDRLCADPADGIGRLSAFLGLKTKPDLASLAVIVDPPASIGRFRMHAGAAFDPNDVAYVASLGFDTFGAG